MGRTFTCAVAKHILDTLILARGQQVPRAPSWSIWGQQPNHRCKSKTNCIQPSTRRNLFFPELQAKSGFFPKAPSKQI